MTLGDGIRGIGFRRWYERQLIECHAWLVTGLLSLILAFSCMEGARAGSGRAVNLLLGTLVVCAAALSVWAFWRYLSMLHGAQRLAEQSVCGACGAYGVLRLVSELQEPPGKTGTRATARLMVECRKCSHRWEMIDADAS